MLCSGHFDTEKMFFFRKMDVNVIAFSCSSSFVLCFFVSLCYTCVPSLQKIAYKSLIMPLVVSLNSTSL